MKKRMLALAISLLMIVSCLAVFPVSAAATDLALSFSADKTSVTAVDDQDSAEGITFTVFAKGDGTYDLSGFQLILNIADDFVIESAANSGDIEYLDENGDPAFIGGDAYTSAVTDGLDGLQSYVDGSKVYFLYDGKYANTLDDIILAANEDVALFTFTLYAKAGVTTEGTVPFSVEKSDLAYNTGSGFALFTASVASVEAIEVAEPAPEGLSSEVYLIDEEEMLIKGVKIETTVAEFIENVAGSANAAIWSPWEYQIEDYENEFITTGTLIDLDGDLATSDDTYAIVIYGDTMCEGIVSTSGAISAFDIGDEFENDSAIDHLSSAKIEEGFAGIYDSAPEAQALLRKSIVAAAAIWTVWGDPSLSTSCAIDLFDNANAIENGLMAYDEFYEIYVYEMMPNYVG